MVDPIQEELKMKWNRGELLAPKQVLLAFDISRPTMYKLEALGIIPKASFMSVGEGLPLSRVYDAKEVMLAAKKYKLERRIKKENKEIQAARRYILSEDEKRIMDCWNYEITKLKCRTIKPILHSDIPALKTIIRRVKRKASIEYLLAQITDYITICVNNASNDVGRKYVYQSLIRFLSRIYDDLRRNVIHWWNRYKEQTEPFADPHPKLTQFIAKEYASYLSMDPNFTIKNPSSEYASFMEIGNRILFLISKYPNSEIINPTRKYGFLVELIFACVDSLPPDRIIYPSTIARDVFWNIEFPTFLKHQLGFVNLSWEGYKKCFQ
jgi:hypothetical protein